MGRLPPPQYLEWAFLTAQDADDRVSWEGFNVLCRQDLALTHILHLGWFDDFGEVSIR